MKIIIEPENEEPFERREYVGIQQFALGAHRLAGEPVHYSVIGDKHALLGLIETLRLDVVEHAPNGSRLD